MITDTKTTMRSKFYFHTKYLSRNPIYYPEQSSGVLNPDGNKNCYINAFNSVDIGENCLIGPNCVISSTNHSFKKNNLII